MGTTRQWFVLTITNAHGDEVRLRQPLYFANLDCLERWVKVAGKVAVKLRKSADGLYPRGTFFDDETGICL